MAMQPLPFFRSLIIEKFKSKREGSGTPSTFAMLDPHACKCKCKCKCKFLCRHFGPKGSAIFSRHAMQCNQEDRKSSAKWLIRHYFEF